MTVVEAEKFKMTAIGPLPPEWEVVKLGESLDTLRNGTTKRQNKDGKGYAVSRIETISTRLVNPAKVGYIESLTDDEVVNYRLRHGDILFSHINSEPYLGNSAIYKDNPPLLIHGMNLLVVRPNISQLGPEFLNFLFNYYRMTGVFVGIASRAVNQSSINQGKLKALLIPLPSIPEQKEIAAVLSAIQEAEKKTEAVIKATRELKKSLMKHLFTYGPVSIAEAEKVPLKESEIGMVPEEWEVLRLVDIAEVKYGKANPKDSGKIPVVGSGGVYSFAATPLVEHPTIVVGRKGTAGRVWLCLSPCYPADTTFYLRWKKEVNVAFIYCHMSLHPLSGIHAKTTLPSLQKPDLENMFIPYPPLPIQEVIADLFMRLEAKVETKEGKKQALETLFKTLLSRLMTGKIRVNNLEVPV